MAHDEGESRREIMNTIGENQGEIGTRHWQATLGSDLCKSYREAASRCDKSRVDRHKHKCLTVASH